MIRISLASKKNKIKNRQIETRTHENAIIQNNIYEYKTNWIPRCASRTIEFRSIRSPIPAFHWKSETDFFVSLAAFPSGNGFKDTRITETPLVRHATDTPAS